MNIKIFLLAIAAFTLASCSSTYKNTQTPDDVYYSPARTIVKNTEQKTKQRRDVRYNSYEDREIRMSLYDSRWRTLNNRYNYGYNLSPYEYDFGYNHYNPYYNTYGNYGGYHGYSNNYNYYGNSGYYYNPYYASYPIYIVSTTKPTNITPRKVNLSAYGQNNATTRPISGLSTTNKSNNNSRSTNRQYNNSNSSSGKSYSQPTYQQPTRTYTPSSNSGNSSGRSSSGSSSSGSSSSGGSVERPTRGNN